jgi:hypothetical protein
LFSSVVAATTTNIEGRCAISREPYLRDPDVTIYQGDALSVLRELPDAIVDCVVTSPPYW